jgi:hypothetical protein
MPETEIEDASQFHQQLCHSRWTLVASHRLHHLAVPEMMGARILMVKPGEEGIQGFRSSRPQPVYDPSDERTHATVQAAASRSLISGLMFDIGSATFGVFRLIFSKRNLYLPTTTRLWFELDTTVKLIRATNTESRIRAYRTTTTPQVASTAQSHPRSE